MLKLEELKEFLEIDSTSPSGLRWKVLRAPRVKARDIAGSLRKDGYYHTLIDGKFYDNHRIVYALYHNLELDKLPKYLDHKDRNPSNNDPCNLRPVTYFQNQGNRSMSKNNTSGVKGVHWSRHAKKWHADIKIDRKKKHLGYFDNIDDAARAYKEASRLYFGEFSSTD